MSGAVVSHPPALPSRKARAVGLGRLRGAPAIGWLCAAVACLNGICWSFITPPFQVPDEPEHVAYVKQLAETGRLPTTGGSFSSEETIVLEDLRLPTVAEKPENQTISSDAQEDKLRRDLLRDRGPPRKGHESAGVAASQPPLYYALEAIPYTLGEGGTLLARIELMRLLSALMGGLTALFTFLFVREALPRVPQAWTVGGLCVALVPLLGFMSGAVNPDSMLYAVTAALFYGLARAFRRGLTRTHAIVLGILVAVGLLTKLNFVGIAPGALLGLILLSVRAARTLGRAAYVSLALALAIAVSPAVAYVALHVASGAPALGIVSSASATTQGSVLSELSYIWQLYLPRLPGMRADFRGVFTTQQIWFDWYVGLYGWLDTTFPGWVYELALIPAGVIGGLCARGALARAGALRARASELAVYGAICIGLMALIGADSYRAFPLVDAEYAQVRYLLPLLPLLGVVLALAMRGAGRRWAPIVGAVLIMLFAAHDIFSQLQVLARFYG
jgi:4-amino-4-deoxy-L-arabinose transferase-like glycosyltransferase